ncbi:MAG: chorismate-binding protein, partial [Gammaproteobacteria bacterium]|nr:chorismate-binding protein [Gammaproteobacteria bacterium]
MSDSNTISVRCIDVDIDLLDLHKVAPARYPHFLESAATNNVTGQFDILFAYPGASIVLEDFGRLSGSTGHTKDFLDALDAWWEKEKVLPGRIEEDLPFLGGWFVYLGYELAGEVEPKLLLQRDANVPIAFATRFPAAVLKRHTDGGVFIIAEQEYEECIEQIERDVSGLKEAEPARGSMLAGELHEEEPERYKNAIGSAKTYIYNGDIFQANLSREWHGQLNATVRAADIYARLRKTNPGPFAGLATWGDAAVISSSPERLIQVRNGIAQTRPIAGTRPRNANLEKDKHYSEELLAHPKERAEHIMLIDLERNDLGRLAVPGTV